MRSSPQTFTTSRSFNHIGCKVLNPLGDTNPSSYRIEVLDSDGNVLAAGSWAAAKC